MIVSVRHGKKSSRTGEATSSTDAIFMNLVDRGWRVSDCYGKMGAIAPRSRVKIAPAMLKRVSPVSDQASQRMKMWDGGRTVEARKTASSCREHQFAEGPNGSADACVLFRRASRAVTHLYDLAGAERA